MAEPCDDCLAARVDALEARAGLWRELSVYLLLAVVLGVIYAWHAGWLRLRIVKE